MRRLRTLLVLALLALLLPLTVIVSGCTAIGSSIGSRWDRQHPPLNKRIAPIEVIKLERGDACGLYLMDSTLVRGVYLGVAPGTPGNDLSASRLMISTGGPGKHVRWGLTGEGMRGISEDVITGLDTTYVPLGQVQYVLVPNHSNGVAIGTLLGLTADVAVVVGVKRSIDHAFDHLFECGSLSFPDLLGGMS